MSRRTAFAAAFTGAALLVAGAAADEAPIFEMTAPGLWAAVSPAAGFGAYVEAASTPWRIAAAGSSAEARLSFGRWPYSGVRTLAELAPGERIAPAAFWSAPLGQTADERAFADLGDPMDPMDPPLGGFDVAMLEPLYGAAPTQSEGEVDFAALGDPMDPMDPAPLDQPTPTMMMDIATASVKARMAMTPMDMLLRAPRRVTPLDAY